MIDAPDEIDLPPVTAVPLPYAFARRHGIVVAPLAKLCSHGQVVGLDAMLEVQRRYGDVAYEAVDDATFEARLRALYGDSSGDAADLAAAGTDLAALADTAASLDELLDSHDDSPVIRLINALLLEAVRSGPSDLHLETQEKRCVVRFRVDGVLRDVVEPSRALAPLLTTRLKVMRWTRRARSRRCSWQSSPAARRAAGSGRSSPAPPPISSAISTRSSRR